MSREMVTVKQMDTKETSGIDGVNLFAEVSSDDKVPRGALTCGLPH